MDRILIVFAHPKEAEATLQALHGEPIQHGLYQFDGGNILISGLGVVNAATSTASALANVDQVWNLGLCGALKSELPWGELFEIATVARYVHLPAPLSAHPRALMDAAYPPLQIAEHGCRLVTLDFPLHHVDLAEQLAQHHDLVDMEGYGVVQAALSAGKRVRMWKLNSDYANSETSQLILDRIDELSHKLARFVCDQLLGKKA